MLSGVGVILIFVLMACFVTLVLVSFGQRPTAGPVASTFA